MPRGQIGGRGGWSLGWRGKSVSMSWGLLLDSSFGLISSSLLLPLVQRELGGSLGWRMTGPRGGKGIRAGENKGEGEKEWGPKREGEKRENEERLN